MSIYYHSTSAYKSQFSPSILFETKEEALAYDILQANNLFIENQTTSSLVEFANGICIEEISKALNFIIEAQKEIMTEKSYRNWVSQNAKAKLMTAQCPETTQAAEEAQ
jgi:hypothetical protein